MNGRARNLRIPMEEYKLVKPNKSTLCEYVRTEIQLLDVLHSLKEMISQTD